MSKFKNAIIAVSGAGGTITCHGAVLTLDLADAEDALEIGKQIADWTGHSVTVRTANGIPLATFPGSTKN
jgi:hypothetical protein